MACYSPASILLLSVVDRAAQETYEIPLASVRCYAKRHGYAHRLITYPDASFEMCAGPVWLFKHCAAHEILASAREHVDVLVQLDGDTAVVMPHVSLKMYLPQVDVVHYERFHTGEVMSGNYMVRNTELARTYLRGYYMRALHCIRRGDNCSRFLNTDNGILHVHLAAASRGEPRAAPCKRTFVAASTLAEYDTCVSSCKQLIYEGARERVGARLLSNGFILIIDRANAWSVDGWTTDYKVSPTSPPMHHASKPWLASTRGGCCRPYDVARIAVKKCALPLHSSASLSDEAMRETIRQADRHFTSARLGIGQSRISKCAHQCFQPMAVKECARVHPKVLSSTEELHDPNDKRRLHPRRRAGMQRLQS